MPYAIKDIEFEHFLVRQTLRGPAWKWRVMGGRNATPAEARRLNRQAENMNDRAATAPDIE